MRAHRLTGIGWNNSGQRICTILVSSVVLVVPLAMASGASATPPSVPSSPGAPTGYVLNALSSGFVASQLSVAVGPANQIVVADPTTGDIDTMYVDGSQFSTVATGFVSAAGLSVVDDSAGQILVADATTGDVWSLNDDGTNATIIDTGYSSAAGLSLALDGASHFVLADASAGTVTEFSLGGDGATVLANGITGTYGISVAASAGTVFLSAAGSIFQIVASSQTPVVLAAGLLASPFSGGLTLSADGAGHLFVAEGDSGSIMELNADGSSPRDVVLGLGSSDVLSIAALNSSELIVANATTGVISIAAPDPLATPGDGAVTVNWTAPLSNGGSALTAYTVTATPLIGEPVTTTFSATTTVGTVWGLSPTVNYSFSVVAVNAIGNSAPSAYSNSVTPDVQIPYLMNAPMVSGEDLGIGLTWSAPYDGGSALLGYDAVATPVVGGDTVTSTFSPLATSGTIFGVPNGVAYTVTMTAVNANGSNAASPPSITVVPATSPGAPQMPSAAAGNQTATVQWSAPNNDGGSRVVSYTAKSFPGNQSCSTSETSCVIAHLKNGLTYIFTVTATNAVGTSPASLPTTPIVPAVAPSSPTSVAARAGPRDAVVTFRAPLANGGAAITSYRVTSSPGGRVCVTATLVCTVKGLTAGTLYHFTVTAKNDAAMSNASVASNTVKILA